MAQPYEFKRSQYLPITVDQAWSFFSNPRNLARITPTSLDFRIVSSAPQEITEGLKIEYRVRPLLGIAMKWVSQIKDVQAPHQFVDEQLQGPYAYWHHLHTFTEVAGGVLMEDVIHYRLPLQKLLPWMNQAIVVKQLDEIFEYRQNVLIKLYPKK